MDILTSLLVFAVLIGLIMLIIIAYTRRIGDLTLTDQFRAAESISDGRFPWNWVGQIKNQARLRILATFGRSKITKTDLALRKLDRLHKFFEHSKFFETEEARLILISNLLTVRERWKIMTWDEMIATATREPHNSP